MAGKVGCALLLAVLFAAAAVSRTSFAVFLASLAVLLVGFLAWYVRTLRRDVTVTLQLPARPVHPDEDFAVLVKLHNNGAAAHAGAACRFAGCGRRKRNGH